MKIIVLILIVFFLISNPVYAGLFGESQPSSGGNAEYKTIDKIPIRDEAYKMLEKRKKEARDLVSEGVSLMREGEKKKKEALITKGRIKKEIGEKQLGILKEQAEMKKKDDQSYGW